MHCAPASGTNVRAVGEEAPQGCGRPHPAVAVLGEIGHGGGDAVARGDLERSRHHGSKIGKRLEHPVVLVGALIAERRRSDLRAAFGRSRLGGREM
jgi:hypothetical protein